MAQKFQRGDLVFVAKDLGLKHGHMEHFPSGVLAVVEGSYADLYADHPPSTRQYALYIKGRGQVSWYYEDQLTMVKRNIIARRGREAVLKALKAL